MIFAERPLRAKLINLLILMLLALPLQGHGLEPADTQPPLNAPSFLSLGIEGYQKILSPVLESNCYMLPSCSVYGKQAFSEYGPLLGLMLTIDRLFHEANEDQTAPLVRHGGKVKLYDPPSANVWWEK